MREVGNRRPRRALVIAAEEAAYAVDRAADVDRRVRARGRPGADADLVRSGRDAGRELRPRRATVGRAPHTAVVAAHHEVPRLTGYGANPVPGAGGRRGHDRPVRTAV